MANSKRISRGRSLRSGLGVAHAYRLVLASVVLGCGLVLPLPAAPATGNAAPTRAERYFNSVRAQPPLLWAFLKDMPKGGDLHSHLSGAVYAESIIGWAAEDGQCVDQKTLVLSKPPCDPVLARVPAKAAHSDPELFRRMIDNWSMRNAAQSGLSGHDLFFDSFGKFGSGTSNRSGDMIAEVTERASAGGVQYLELMLTPASSEVFKVAASSGWDDDFARMRSTMLANGMADAVKAATDALTSATARQREILRCGAQKPAAGCDVTVRYLYQVLRGLPKERVFAQMLAGFELASVDPRVVGLNLVMPEDALVPMRDFSLHMRMLDYLHTLYPKVHITLHAGELAPGLVPPEGLRFHIRDSIDVGHAQRIGHGVAVMQEDDALSLLKKMARNKILVEVCLTSNTGILGVSGDRHPLAAYLKYGVPIALATDDEGVSRSEMTHEYLKAVLEQKITYRQLKTMARNSLQYAFVEGASLWHDMERQRPVTACAAEPRGAKPAGLRCQAYLEQNLKARLQWALEASLAAFERKY